MRLTPDGLQLIGLIANVIGTFLMARGYFARAELVALPKILCSGLVRGKTARGTAALYDGDGTGEGKSDTHVKRAAHTALAMLQGLSLIATGFLLQTAGMLWQIYSG